jgi:hypothetical protein
VAVIGFFSYIDQLGNSREWENALRWLSSSTGIRTTESSERIQGHQLESCDYTLSHPEILDQAMLLYTALTRARNRLYIIEIEESGQIRNRGSVGLEAFAFRRLKDLDLIKMVNYIDEGLVDMTPQQHKARGVLLVNEAIDLSRKYGGQVDVKKRFIDAEARFRHDKGNDRELLDQCHKHMEIVLLKHSLIETMKKMFFDPSRMTGRGEYSLEGRFADVLSFKQGCSEFFSMCICDSFLAEEISELRALVEDLFAGTPYEVHFGEICKAIKRHEP